MADQAGALIREEIKKHGAMSVARYMELALTQYYGGKDPLGAQGDFTTAPEISQIFGELIGAWCADLWQQMGGPEVALVELGPGRGTLMKDALRATKHVPGFHEKISVHLVETSQALREKQKKLLEGSHARIEWHETIETLPDVPCLIIANEFFDALPVRQFAGGKERLIEINAKGDFCWTFSNVVPTKVGIQQEKKLDPRVRGDDDVREVGEAGQRIVRMLSEKIKKSSGALLMVDYGYERGVGDTLQAVKNHEYVEVLSSPGEADITAHVDFGALKNAAVAAGAKVAGPVSQGRFLTQLGALQRAEMLCAKADAKQKDAIMSGLARLISEAQMGELFKVMAVVGLGLKPQGF